MRRVAVHEAGHAVARLISSTRGGHVSFVTIIPRMDGSLGFVASVPLDGHVLTRRTMLEALETALAGRAAEEVVFGADDIGQERAGRATSSDLAVATRLAELVVCQSGLGDDGALHWTEHADPRPGRTDRRAARQGLQQHRRPPRVPSTAAGPDRHGWSSGRS